MVAIRDDNNTPIGAIAVNRDITERKKTSLALQESQERLALATEVGQIGVWDWDVQNDVLIWDDATYQHFGIKADEFIGSSGAWTKAVHPDDLTHTERHLQAALNSDRDYKSEYRLIQPDGAIRYIKDIAAVHRDEHGTAIRMIGVIWDITAQKEAERELASHRDHLAELVEERTTEWQIAKIEAEKANQAKEHLSGQHEP